MAHNDQPSESRKDDTEFPLLKDDSAPDAAFAADGVISRPASDPLAAADVRKRSFADRFAEQPAPRITAPEKLLALKTRRDFLLYGAGVALGAAGFWQLLPEDTQQRPFTAQQRAWMDSLEARLGGSQVRSSVRKEKLLNRVLTFDDDVAEALYSQNRSVPTYDKAWITPNLRNNYDGQTPDPGYIAGWSLTISGLASGTVKRLGIEELLTRFTQRDQITRLVCVEGWSAIVWWGGLRFADLMRAYPPAPGARWARLDSSVNLDGDGNPDPYYVSLDLPTAAHPQTLLATHRNNKALDVEHGAPLRLVVPMKLGLKNIKAITKITYTDREPADYWNERGYSKYDGL